MKVGQRWWHVPSQRVMLVEAINGGLVQGREYDGGVNRWENDDQKMREFGWQLLSANQVYQHGDELFVTMDATPRMRNLRTGLTICPRVPFKYLGEMPQVGQVWVGELTKLPKRIKRIEDDTVYVELGNGTEKEIRLRALFSNHYLRNFHFATGNEDAIKVEHQGRRYILREYQVEAEAKMRGSVGLYMSPIGDVFRVVDAAMGRVILAAEDDAEAQYVVQENHFREFYKALPLPGQLWAKGGRYVTVDRVEDGRVHYTGGSSGLRRFLNEYARVTIFTGRSPNVQQIKKAVPEYGTSAMVAPRPFLTSNRMQQMLGHAPCPLNTATLNRLNAGDALGNWTKYRNTLGEKIRYANQRIKELSK